MTTKAPADALRQLNPVLASPVCRHFQHLGQFTANTTITLQGPIFDRPAVIREIWFVADAVPADPDGTMLIDVHVRDASEDAFDSIVNDFDCEAQLATAFEAKKATLVAETSEDEYTVQAGDSLRFQLINNSGGIGTNANIGVLVLYQPIESVD